MREESNRKVTVPQPGLSPALPAPLRVLVVDDSARDRQLFEYLLEDFRAQYTLALDCEHARSGPQALARLAQTGFDLLGLDQNMPEMSGSEVLAALHTMFRGSASPRPRVLAYSTCDAPEFRHRCLREGADGFCSKYMSPQDLAQVLRDLGLDPGAQAP